MSRLLLRSSSFVRAARRVVKKHPAAAEEIRLALVLLAQDPYDPQLRTHKLKGKLRDSWACSAGYDLRLIFSFVRHGEDEALLLETIGTHEEVY